MLELVKGMMVVSLCANEIDVRLRTIHVLIECKDHTSIAVFWVTDRVDCWLLRFHQRHLAHHWKKYDCRLAQVIELYKESVSPTKKVPASEQR